MIGTTRRRGKKIVVKVGGNFCSLDKEFDENNVDCKNKGLVLRKYLYLLLHLVC